MNNPRSRAIFLDRDGVLIDDVDLLTRPEQIRILEGVPEALRRLAEAGFKLIVVSNQSVVARGLLTEPEVENLNRTVEARLLAAGAPALDAFYYCPHHPNATVPEYRSICECRKPQPGLLRRAERDFGIDLPQSFLIGDRLTDIEAGQRAGCRTVWVQTGKHTAPRIQTAEPLDLKEPIQPDYTCPSLKRAAQWILETL